MQSKREIVRIEPERIIPDSAAVLRNLGGTPTARQDERIGSLVGSAQDLLVAHAVPVGIFAQISVEEFLSIYRGEGLNEPRTPLDGIFPRADHLALLAVTLGKAISAQVNELLEGRQFALAAVLDAVASEATEMAGNITEGHFLELLESRGYVHSGTKLLRYSPGYCGWHVSGQKALFAALEPEGIGISLSESFLMDPLKSVSGVIVVGPAEIHRFADNYPFCAACRARECRARMG